MLHPDAAHDKINLVKAPLLAPGGTHPCPE